MQKSFAQILILAGLGLAAGCQTDREMPAAGANRRGADQPLFNELPPSMVADGDVGRPGLIPPGRAQQALKNFKGAYQKLGSPRFLVHLDGESLDHKSAGAADSREQGNDIEMAFGKILRTAGATLADQKTADALMSGKELKAPNPAAAKAARDRDSLRKIADVGIEILITSIDEPVKNAPDKAASLPEIQATAIRLQDARIIGQASTSILQASGRRFSPNDASEALALLLIEDLIRVAK